MEKRANELETIKENYLTMVRTKEIGKQAALLGYKNALQEKVNMGYLNPVDAVSLERSFQAALWDI